MVVVLVQACRWCWAVLLDGGGGGGLGPSSPLVDGGGSIHGWLLMAVGGGACAGM